MIQGFPPRPRAPSAPKLDGAQWTAMCKAAVAVAVADGRLTAGEACDFCCMDEAELEVWQHVVRDHGLRRMFTGPLGAPDQR